jgi:hypothetical protein
VSAPFNPADAAARTALLALRHAAPISDWVVAYCRATRPLVEYVGALEERLARLDTIRAAIPLGPRCSACGKGVRSLCMHCSGNAELKHERDALCAVTVVSALLVFVHWAQAARERCCGADINQPCQGGADGWVCRACDAWATVELVAEGVRKERALAAKAAALRGVAVELLLPVAALLLVEDAGPALLSPDIRVHMQKAHDAALAVIADSPQAKEGK